LKLFFLLIFLSLFSTNLLAFKDAFYMGVSQGQTIGESTTKELSASEMTYDLAGEITAIKMGSDFNIDRAHRFKGRWEFSLEERAYTYEKDGLKEELGGHQYSASFLWGYNVDFMLNDELVPFVKIGYGVSNTDTIGEAYHGIYGVGVYFITKHFEIGAGIDREGKKPGGVRLDEETLTDPVEESFTSYVTLNIRLY
jgi:hypothetical protein